MVLLQLPVFRTKLHECINGSMKRDGDSCYSCTRRFLMTASGQAGLQHVKTTGRSKIWKESRTVLRKRKESHSEAEDQFWQSNQIKKATLLLHSFFLASAHLIFCPSQPFKVPVSILFSSSPVSGWLTSLVSLFPADLGNRQAPKGIVRKNVTF